jgi:hypothetical protein
MLHSGENLSMKKTKGNNSKIMKGRVIILVHCQLLSEIYAPVKFHVDISKAF